MPTVTVDAPFLELTAAAIAHPLPAAIHEARATLPAIVHDILAIPESALERPWAWTGGGDDVDVRYGIYRLHEQFDRAAVDAARAIRPSGRDGGLAAALVGPTAAARWDLHGVLAPLTGAEIGADPGGGEWSIRRTMGHIINSQRGYAWGSAWWLSKGYAVDAPDIPAGASDEFWAALPAEDGEEQAGTPDELRARLDAIGDLAAERFGGLTEAQLATACRWSGFVRPASFRMSRWASHLHEHTIQIEKTLVMLARTPSEPERLVRLTLAAYGRAESVVSGQPDAAASAGIIRDATAEARRTIAEVRLAAGA